ncbi:SPFH domain-containing protein [Frederiksenia canicola]
MELYYFIGGIAVVGLLIVSLIIALMFRRVVKTNEVHIVQSGGKTTSYGKDTGNGNVYYAFPSWLPVIGVSTIVLPVSVFSIKIDNYEAYDLERLPFVVDLTAFFRISDSNLAAQRVSDFRDMNAQLVDIIQGSVRSILSSRNLNDILQVRSELGDDFTTAVKEQLKNWGIEPVKTIELMDIRDSGNSHVILNIMEIKKSFIEKESRVEVARNQKEAQIAEIEAKKESDVKQQEAEKEVGLKTVENQREVAISNEQAQQRVKEQEKITKEREMDVKRVAEVKQAEIAKDVQIVKADQDKRTQEIKAEANRNALIIDSEAEKQHQILVAEGEKQKAFLAAEALLETKDKEAQGIAKIGTAEADAKQKLEISLVSGQIELAKEIGSNVGYQQYLVSIRQIEANQAIGIEQAKALANSDMKFIINEAKVDKGIERVGELFSSTGGTKLAATLEGLNQSELGKALIGKFLGNNDQDKPKA